MAVYTAQKRVKEIGVRKILGAGTGGSAVERLLALVAIIVIACPLPGGNDARQQFAYRQVSVGDFAFVGWRW